MNGTPKTLAEALSNAAAPKCTYLHVKDFLAQKFSVAVLKAKSDEQERMLRELFKAITQGEK